MKKKTKLLLFLCAITGIIYAQDEVFISDSTGIDDNAIAIAFNNEGTAIEKTDNASSSSIVEPHSYGLELVTIQDKEGLNFALSAWLEPTEESIILNIDEFDGLGYRLTDLDGRILEANPIVSVETTIEIVYLISSVYFIEVSSDKEALKTFKIIKK